jgi:hypothetical protein
MKVPADALRAYRQSVDMAKKKNQPVNWVDSQDDNGTITGLNPKRPANQVLGANGVAWEQDGKYYDANGFEVAAP